MVKNITQMMVDAPTIAWGDFKQLPEHPGVYAVRNDTKYLYIGATINLRNRWLEHHRMAQIEDMYGDEAEIAYIELSSDAIEQYEQAAIEALNPTLNNTPVMPSINGRKHCGFKLSDETVQQIERLAKRLRWTKTQVVEAGVKEFGNKIAAAAALQDAEPGSIVLIVDESTLTDE